MADTTSIMDIHNHGVCVDKTKNRVQCNYCGKQITSFSRLKYHLGGVGPDVTSCDQVTFTIRETFRNMIKNKEKPGIKRLVEAQMSSSLRKHRRREEQISSIKTVSSSPQNNSGSVVEANKQKSLSNKAQKSIARFFYENCFDFSAADSPGFKEMMRATNIVSGDQMMRVKFPDSNDLNGWMLQEALKEVQEHVKKVKDSWKITGCSVLLDAWVDQKGRDLVAFVADCPAGPVYLISVDVSDIKDDVTALASVVDGLVEEVGVDNVVQIVVCSTSGWVGELGKSFTSSNIRAFWSVSISHCFELMLVKIQQIGSFGDILDKVNNISKFINNSNSHGIDIAASSSSEFEFVTPYLTLEGVFKAKNNLVAMFASSNLNIKESVTISKLVKDSSFWEVVERAVKSTSPLIHGLLLFSTAENQHLGYVYDTMDSIKENIAKEFEHNEPSYRPVWDVIDDVWNTQLHSPLHVTGYFLNPAAFYSTDFNSDPEVTTGFISSLVRMVKDNHIQAKISSQLQMYTLGKDCFDEASQADQISSIGPAEWWAKKASGHPELQSFAIKILSQTCEGASRYKLKRNLAEKLLLSEGMSRNEHKHVKELAFVHYNLHLQSCKAKLSEEQ